MTYVLSAALISYWNDRGVNVANRQAFLLSISLNVKSPHTGKPYEFGANCAYVWESKEPMTMSWDTFNIKFKNVKYTTLHISHFNKWERKRLEDKVNALSSKEIENSKQNENVNRLQKQNAEISGGIIPEGSRVKGVARKTSVGVGHLSYHPVKN